MSSLKILHVASFSGNIGDNANHMGFYPWIEQLCARNIEWSRLEIREFFWSERSWDINFVNLANTFDAVVIGGGNYFELWVESSPTGTSIAIDLSLFEKIKVPVYFNALGVDPGQGVPDCCRERFQTFLNLLDSSDQYLVSVRNDGALKNLKNYVGDALGNAVYQAPDNAFFARFKPIENSFISKSPERKLIVINVACDMAKLRFGRHGQTNGQDLFAHEMAQSIEKIAEIFPESDFVCVPHIHSDLTINSQIISILPDRLRRTRVFQAPYGIGDKAASFSFGLYALSDLTLGMRFHANVCSLGLQRQTIGLNSYLQIESLYEGLDQSDRLVNVSDPGFTDTLVCKVEDAITTPDRFNKTPLDAITVARRLRAELQPHVKTWLDNL